MRRAERHQLDAVITEVRAWVTTAQDVRQFAAHLPLSGAIGLSPSELQLLVPLERAAASGDLNEAALLTQAVWFDGRKKLQPARQSADRIMAFHHEYRSAGAERHLAMLRHELSARADAERGSLRETLGSVNALHAQAVQMLHDAAHLPITRADALTDAESAAAGWLMRVFDEHREVASRLLLPGACPASDCARSHASARALGAILANAVQAGVTEQIRVAATRISAQLASERDRLASILDRLDRWRSAAKQALLIAEHLPLTRSGALSDIETAAVIAISDLVDPHGIQARRLLDPALCAAGACADPHHSASVLSNFHEASCEAGTGNRVIAAAERLSAQLGSERKQVSAFCQQVTLWAVRIQRIRRSREEALASVRARVLQLVQESVSVEISRTAMRILPLPASTDILVASLALLHRAPLTAGDDEFLGGTARLAESVLAAARGGFTEERKCRGGGKCAQAHEVIPAAYERAGSIEAELKRLAVDAADMPGDVDLLLDPSLGFMSYLPDSWSLPEILPADLTERSRAHLGAVINAESAAKQAARRARDTADEVRAAGVMSALKAMDLEVLKKATPDRVRVGPLESFGLHNVWDVYQFLHQHSLESASGMGETSARAVAQATLRLYEAVREDTPVRIDVKHRGELTTTLLERLRTWDSARKFAPTADEVALAGALAGLFRQIPRQQSSSRFLAVVYGPDSTERPPLADILAAALGRIASARSADIWTDFLSRPADYFGMLTELGFMTEDEKKMHGDLPEEIVEAVRAKELKRGFLTASLRTYQSFGARFALAQERVVIGDEMGLGKTVEALAVLAHLRASGQSHFLVVCPAAVVSNWIRETAKHTKLSASRLHGPLWERSYAAKSWVRDGGVAVTTYDLLLWAQEFLSNVALGCVVFDEAHYIKNPYAKRSLAAAEIMNSVGHTVLMTGTPLENSVQEFRNLIGYIRPDLSESAPEYLASKFRKHVAPVYLRRNQEDVLSELPELVEIDEWMGMSEADERAYRDAVQEGRFMLMRRAAMLSEHSLKVQRLREIVEEAESNGRRVIVFSYFREVLATIARVLPGEVFGPLTGAVEATERQSLVDRFSQAGDGAVLVAQIIAGGVGFNIQSASVVVICEPQIKPTTESQAIARAHRMGQTNTVQVHRLLTENSVDERIRSILAGKRQLFDEFARDSVIAEQAPDAVDVTEAELARMVVAEERERLFG
jgi:hypothetical protein